MSKKPLSLDLRERVVAAALGGMSHQWPAERFGVSAASSVRWCCRQICDEPHLAEIARNIATGRHAVLLLDQAGWHMTDKLDVPANIADLR
jgi:hypothetical protein